VCSSDLQEITVYPVPTADFSSDPKDTCRVPVSVRFNNLSSGAFSYAWSFGNGNTSNFVNPSTIYTKVGAFPVKLISSNQFNCSDTIESDYMIYNAPKAGLDFKLNSGCPPIVINFENTSTFGTKYLWSFGDGDTSSEINPGHIYVKPGSYKVRLIANGGSNCADTIEANKTIKIFSKPNPSFSHVLIQDKKPYRTVVFSSQLDSVESYEWYYKGSLIGRGSSPSYRFADADSGSLEITLKTSSIDGCDSSITQTIELPSYWNGLFVPNAFTPTLGQGGANEFKPIGIELKYYSARVFNKWGELVWESTKLTPNGEPEFGWDGTDKKGIPCPQGTYIWVVEAEFTDGKAWKGMKLDDGNLHTKGNVSLIR
jgi:PKD repeat protein